MLLGYFVTFCREPSGAGSVMEEHPRFIFALLFLPISSFLAPFNSQAPRTLQVGLPDFRWGGNSRNRWIPQHHRVVSLQIQADNQEQGGKRCWQRVRELCVKVSWGSGGSVTGGSQMELLSNQKGFFLSKYSLSHWTKQRELPDSSSGMQMHCCCQVHHSQLTCPQTGRRRHHDLHIDKVKLGSLCGH